MAYSALLANGKQRRYFKNLKQECWVEEQRRRTGSPRHSFRSQMLHLAPAQTVGGRGHPLLGRRGRAGLGGRARQAATLPHTLQRMVVAVAVADLLVAALARVTGCQSHLPTLVASWTKSAKSWKDRDSTESSELSHVRDRKRHFITFYIVTFTILKKFKDR